MQIAQERLATQFLPLVVEDDALQLAGGRPLALTHAADEQAAPPTGKAIAVVERPARQRDGRHPVKRWLLEALARVLRVEPRSAVVAAIAGKRPSVILAGQDDVDLVAAVRSLLAGPQLSVVRVHGETELIAEPHGVDVRLESRLADVGIIRREAAVIAHAQELAGVVVAMLRSIEARCRARGRP